MKLQDKQLLAKLSAGDLIAQDAQYHVQCLVLYNRARETKPSDNFDMYTVNEGIAFAELVYRRFPHGRSSCSGLQTHRFG